MIRTIIVADISKNADEIQEQLVKHCPEIKVISKTNNKDKAIKAIEKHSPQLLFIEIGLSGKSGFDLIERYKERNFHVIFIMPHNEFSTKAFQFPATDYLLMPISPEILKHAVQKVKRQIESLPKKNNTYTLHQTLRIPSSRGVTLVQLTDIIRLRAEGHYTHIYLMDGKHYLSSYHLQHYEELLNPQLFLRAHRSHIINYKHISRVNKKQGLLIEMSDGFRVEIPRRNKKEFFKTLESCNWKTGEGALWTESALKYTANKVISLLQMPNVSLK